MVSCQASSNPYLQPLVVLAIETAMRRGELLGLRWEHVQLDKSYVHLPMTKNGDSRDVPLSPSGTTNHRGAAKEPDWCRDTGPPRGTEGPLEQSNPKGRHHGPSVP